MNVHFILTPEETAEVLTALHLHVRALAKAKEREHSRHSVNAMRSINGAIEETGQQLRVEDGYLVVAWPKKKAKQVMAAVLAANPSKGARTGTARISVRRRA